MPEAERLSKKMNSWPRSDNFLGQVFDQGHYPPIYQQVRKGFIHFLTLRLISTTRTLYCGKEKTSSEGHSTFAAQQNQAD